MKIQKITITDDQGKDYVLPLMEETNCRYFSGTRGLPVCGGWAERVPNGNNPFIIMSADPCLHHFLNEKISDGEVRSFIEN